MLRVAASGATEPLAAWRGRHCCSAQQRLRAADKAVALKRCIVSRSATAAAAAAAADDEMPISTSLC